LSEKARSFKDERPGTYSAALREGKKRVRPEGTATHTVRIRQFIAWLLFLALMCWGTMAIIFSNLSTELRLVAAGAFGVSALGSIILPRKNSWKITFYSSVFALVLVWWLALPPSNDRDWQPDVAKLSFATITGNTVTIHNIRNCDYRTESDYVVRHYDRTFDLESLHSMDLYVVDWGLPHMAHTMLSFGFDKDEYVCFSIETRKKKGEQYSAVRGFFKQYELITVVADERDVVRLRTNYRKGEDVYLYRLKAPPELIRKVFLDYVHSINMLTEKPQWYNALTVNCTTGIWRHIVPYYPKAGFDWRILASGHVDEMAYELGTIDQTLPFPEIKRRSRINERSKAADPGRTFSRIIRQDLPGLEKSPGRRQNIGLPGHARYIDMRKSTDAAGDVADTFVRNEADVLLSAFSTYRVTNTNEINIVTFKKVPPRPTLSPLGRGQR